MWRCINKHLFTLYPSVNVPLWIIYNGLSTTTNTYCSGPNMTQNDSHYFIHLFPEKYVNIFKTRHISYTEKKWCTMTNNSEQYNTFYIVFIYVLRSNACICINFIIKKNWILLFSKDALNWSKVTVKAFIMLQKISISNKCCFYFSKNPEKCIVVYRNILSSKRIMWHWRLA